MNSAELRRLVSVSLGALVLVVASITVVATVLETDASDLVGGADEAIAPAPRIGLDHWHATYEIWVCGEQQPNVPLWQGGVHTHDDGIIHIHPFEPFEEGHGARLVKWFEYGGGLLSEDQLRIPGTSVTLTDGDVCPDRTTARVHVYVNGDEMFDYSEYIPQDGDHIVIWFGVAGPLARLP